MEQKLSMAEGPFPAQRSPYLPDLQTILELCSWDLSGGRSAGVLWDSAQAGQAPLRLQPREPRSAAATDLHTPIILLSEH